MLKSLHVVILGLCEHITALEKTVHNLAETHHSCTEKSPGRSIINKRTRNSRDNMLSDEVILSFWRVWRREYVCDFFINKGCRFTAYECKRLHMNVTKWFMTEELRTVDKTKSFNSSDFFNRCTTYGCTDTVNALRKHIEDICGITYRKRFKI